MAGRAFSTAGGAMLAALSVALSASAAGPDYSALQRNPSVLQGTIEAIAADARTLVLVQTDGRRRTIHLDDRTVVFTQRADHAQTRVVAGTEAAVRCHREIARARGFGRDDVCPMLLIADSVYLAAD